LLHYGRFAQPTLLRSIVMPVKTQVKAGTRYALASN